jgi:heme exporter protein A
VLEAVRLACVRGERRLFDRLSFEVGAGELFWVSGPNGSGKTSLLRMLCTLLPPESGELRWRGAPVRELGEAYLSELAYLGHAPAVKDDLTAEENLRFALAQQGVRASRAQALAALRAYGLAGSEELPARALSQGQRRRVALARLELCEARALWVLDEPLTALDAQAVTLVRGRIAAHLGRGGVVVLTSHQEVNLSGLRVRRLALGAAEAVA